MVKAIALLLLPTITFAQKADVILTNGKIFTSDTSQLYVDAIAIKGTTILAIGSNPSIQKLATAKTKRIDLQGRTVVPGFNDAHDHLAWLLPGDKTFITPFSAAGPSKQTVIDSLSILVKKARPGEWLQGTIGLAVFTDTTIRRRLLDSLAPQNPVALLLMWGHGAVVNSAALKAINITDNVANPLGGWYERQPGTAYITGALYEYAQFPFWQAVTTSNRANAIKRLRSYAIEQLDFGITSVQNMSSTLQAVAAKSYFSEANLPLRTRIIAMPSTTEHGRLLSEWKKLPVQLSPLTVVSGIKYIIDGTSLEQTALKSKPYPNKRDYYGRLDFPVDTIKKILLEALTTNNQLMMHITGDSATKIVLQLMKGLAAPEIWKTRRVRIEHGNGITAATAQDIKALGIIVVHTPQYGMNNPIATWLLMGIPVAIGPDGLTNPFINIAMVCSRQANKAENITREQAVIAYTKTNAYAEFAEGKKGTLTPGKVADIAVLSQDIFTVPIQLLPATRSVMTIVNGKIIFKKF